MDEEQVHECEKCGHAYSKSYGSWVEVLGGASWRCFPCQKKERS